MSIAVAGFDSMHVEHDQVSAVLEGGFIPAEAQSKPDMTGLAFVGWPGRGASQIVHLSTADDGFESMHSGHVQDSASALAGGLIPAAFQSNEIGAVVTALELSIGFNGMEKSKIGREDVDAIAAALRAVTCPRTTTEDVSTVKVYDGRSFTVIAIATSFGDCPVLFSFGSVGFAGGCVLPDAASG